MEENSCPNLHLEPRIVVRKAQGADLNFIYATLINSFSLDKVGGKTCQNQVFYNEYRQVLDHILATDTTLIACNPDEPQVIYGYLIYTLPNVLHYIFIKDAWREAGIASALFCAAFPAFNEHTEIFHTHETRQARSILLTMGHKFPHFIHNPYLLYKKGDPSLCLKS